MSKICAVCGEKAKGRNFGAVSCESCKAFFRRCIIMNLRPKCRLDNKCELNGNNRKLCQKCRLDQCLAVGMRKELVYKPGTNEDSDMFIKRSKSRRLNERISETSTSSDGNTSSDSDHNSMSDWMTNSSEESKNNWMTNDMELDLPIENLCLTEDEVCEGIRRMEEFLMESEDSLEVTQTAVTPTSVVPIVRPIGTYDKPLNDIELNRFNELSYASDVFKAIYNTPNIKNCIEITSLSDMYEKMSAFDVYDTTLLESINFCKGLSLYKEVCDQDKMALFKSSYHRILSLRCIPTYNQDHTFKLPISNDSCLRIHLNMVNFPNEKLYQLTTRFYDNVWQLKCEPILINLLMAFILFDSNTPQLIHKELVKLNQQMYLYLIQRYLILKVRSEEQSSGVVSKLMKILIDLQQICSEDMKNIKSYHQFLTPLAKELCGI